MAKFAHDDVLDGGLNVIKNAAVKVLLISAYTAGDSYATVQANKLAEATMAFGDYSIASNAGNRVLTTATGKTAVVSTSAAGTPDLHFAFTDGSAKVLWVTDELSNQAITAGNTITFPALSYTTRQPV